MVDGYPFDLWRVYLHPVQHRVAYGDFSGPMRVTGGPGTGKTVAVPHRAKHLAEKSTIDRSVLVTTFTRTLTSSLDDQLRTLVDDEDVLRRIDVRHVDQLANQVVTAEHGRRRCTRRTPGRRSWTGWPAKCARGWTGRRTRPDRHRRRGRGARSTRPWAR